jgi:hypothetical protein
VTDPVAYAALAAVSLAPLISVRYIAGRYLDGARDLWLVGLAWVGALALCWHTLPLGLAAIAVLAHWRSWEQLPAVLTWAGIIATWLLVQALPPWAIAFLPTGWRVTVGALMLTGIALAQKRRKMEIKASTGTRIMLAALLVLVWPFTAWWEWPVYAYGLWLTSSWVALLALLVAVSIRYPMAAPYAGAVLALVVLCFTFPWSRRTILDRTPRGSSFDGWHERWRTWQAMVRLGRRWPIWLLGAGPESASHLHRSLRYDLMRESMRLTTLHGRDVSMTGGPTHCEPLEYAYTYGLLGVATLAALTWHLIPRLALGDPWSASALAGLVVACAAMPARVAPIGLVWLVTLAVIGGR